VFLRDAAAGIGESARLTESPFCVLRCKVPPPFIASFGVSGTGFRKNLL